MKQGMPKIQKQVTTRTFREQDLIELLGTKCIFATIHMDKPYKITTPDDTKTVSQFK